MGQLFSKKPSQEDTMEWDPLFLARFPHLADSIFEQLSSKTILRCYESGCRPWKAYFDGQKLNVYTTSLIREGTGCSVSQIKRTILNTTLNLETLLFQLEVVFQNTSNNMRGQLPMFMRYRVDPWKTSSKVVLFYTLNTAVELGYIGVYQLMAENMENKNPSGGGSHRLHQGETPLHTAAKHGHLELCRLITKDLAEKNPFGRWDTRGTPLHLAARYGHYDVCELILNQVDVKNPSAKLHASGYTPREVANAHGHQDICWLIDDFIKRLGPGTPVVVPDDE